MNTCGTCHWWIRHRKKPNRGFCFALDRLKDAGHEMVVSKGIPQTSGDFGCKFHKQTPTQATKCEAR